MLVHHSGCSVQGLRAGRFGRGLGWVRARCLPFHWIARLGLSLTCVKPLLKLEPQKQDTLPKVAAQRPESSYSHRCSPQCPGATQGADGDADLPKDPAATRRPDGLVSASPQKPPKPSKKPGKGERLPNRTQVDRPLPENICGNLRYLRISGSPKVHSCSLYSFTARASGISQFDSCCLTCSTLPHLPHSRCRCPRAL